MKPQRQRALLDRLESKFSKDWRKEIQRAMNDAAREYSTEASIMLAMREHKERSDKIMRVTYETSARLFAKPYYDEGKGEKTFTDFLRSMRAFINNVGLKKISEITRTTENQIRAVINRGVEQGESLPEISRSITARSAVISGARAAVIARTETHTSAMWAQVESIKDLGLDLRKQWLAAKDERTREDHAETDGQTRWDHAEPDGQTVGMNEAFIVSGEPLMFPGDPNGSAGNVINCRCVMNFVE